MHLYFTRIDASLTQELWSKLVRQLPQDLQSKNSRFRFLRDRFRNLFGILLLEKAYVTHETAPFDYENLMYDPNRRPYIKHSTSDFNISHSGELVVCAYANTARVGVDVEVKKEVPLRDFQNTMNEDQWREIHASPDPYDTFFQYWTIKESVIKADGRGLSIPLEEILIKKDSVSFGEDWWYIHPLDLHPGHKSCLASNRPIGLPEVIEVNWQEFVK